MDIPIPRAYSLVKVTENMVNWLKSKSELDSPLLMDERFVFLGEIPNMPGHCVVASFSSGRLISGYHTGNFVELDQDEV